jgi:ComF family protein
LQSSLISGLKDGISHLFYPRLCEGCNKPLVGEENVLCVSCGLEIPETGYHEAGDNETALRFAGRIPFAHATSLAYFTNDGLLQHLVHGLKYKGKKETGYYLGKRLGHCLLETTWGPTVDLVIPVPLHAAKKAKRGYNQSMYIAEGLAAALKIPASDHILERVRNTDSQTNKTRAERVDNMKEAFRINKNARLGGKHILLCDDILTTGATLEACAIALFKEESIKISIVTIGIAIS